MGGQFLPPHSDGQNSAVFPVPGLCSGSTSGRPVSGSRRRNTFCFTYGLPSMKWIGPSRALEKPQVAVAGHVDQTLDGAPAALVVHQDRRRNFVPVPGIVGVVLEVSFDLARGRRRARCVDAV